MDVIIVTWFLSLLQSYLYSHPSFEIKELKTLTLTKSTKQSGDQRKDLLENALVLVLVSAD